MATIQRRVSKNGCTSYRVMVRLKGHPAQHATFARKTDARLWGERVETAIRDGRYSTATEARRRTLAELIDRYIDEYLAAKPKARRKDLGRLLRWWKGRLGDYFLADVTPALVAAERTALSRRRKAGGKRLAPATVNRYLGALSHAFTIAEREWGWAENNPLRRVNRLKEPRGRVRFLSDDERERLLEASRKAGDRRLYPLIVLAISTGARQGELLSLRWPDIDLARGVAVVHHTKNGERRALPLAGLASEVMAEWSKVRRLDTDLVFASARSQALFPRGAWERALRAAEIEDFRFHDLRHSAASYLAMSGATLAEIAEVLGHKTLAMVKRYSHMTDQHTSKVVARMNERIFGGGAG